MEAGLPKIKDNYIKLIENIKTYTTNKINNEMN